MARETLTLAAKRKHEWREWAEARMVECLNDGALDALHEADDLRRELDGLPTREEEYA